MKFFGFLLINFVSFSSTFEMSLSTAFTNEKLIPDLLDSIPDKTLKVTYESGVCLKPGDVLTPTQVKDQPEVEFDAEDGSFYTLLMTDLDAPSRADPKFREIRHWLVVNISGSSISEGETKWAYIGSGPPSGSGLHRYTFLLFKQLNGKQDFSDLPTVPNTSRDGRISTNTRDLIKKFNLEVVAGNFYQAEFDDYVPILHAQLGGPPPKAN